MPWRPGSKRISWPAWRNSRRGWNETLTKRGATALGLRSWVKRVEHAARGNLASFELLDGSRYYYDPASWELFMHWYECLGETSTHNWPEAPEVIRKLCEAKDPQAALDAVMEEQRTFGTFAYDPDILVNERRLEPWGLVGSYTTYRAENIASGTPTTPRSRTSPSPSSHNTAARAASKGAAGVGRGKIGADARRDTGR